MNIPYPFKKDKQNAQSMVEFALVLPLLLLILFGLMELGRLLGFYVAVISASREAARYGSAAGDVGGFVAHYQDCDGIRAAGKRVGFFADLEDADFTIAYDQGSEAEPYAFGCPAPTTDIELGDRVVITVSQEWQPIVPLVGLAPVNLTSVTRRTILKAVEIEGTPAPNSAPKIYFATASSKCIENSSDKDSDPPGCQDEMTVRINLDWDWTEDILVNFNWSSTSADSSGAYWDFQVLTSSPVVIPRDTLGVDIVVKINPDTVYEGGPGTVECINFELGDTFSPSEIIQKSTPTSHTLCIEDDEDPPTVFFIGDGVQDESVRDYAPIAQLSHPSQMEVRVFLNDTHTGTASYEGLFRDYYFIEGINLYFHPYAEFSDTSRVNIQIINDFLDEDDETVILKMISAVNATIDPSRDTHTLTIRDEPPDPPPTVYFSPAAQTGGKNLSEMFADIQLSKPSGRDIEVTYRLNTESTATYGVDFTLDPAPNPLGVVTIPAHETSAPITITLLPSDEPEEPNETVILDLVSATSTSNPNPAIVAPSQHIATITNQDVPPTVYFSTPGQSTYENAGQVFVRARLTFASPQEIRVPFTLSGTATKGTDYELEPSSTLVFPANTREKDIVVTIEDDELYEENETIVIELGTPLDDRAVLGLPRRHTITIYDDDQIPTVSFTRSSQNGSESAGTLTASLQLSGASGKPITVPYTVSGTATAGEDYTLSTDSPITFAPGVTSADIVVEIIDDDEYESEETVVLTLGEPENALLGAPSTHTMYLLDNDMPVCSGIYTIGTVTVDKNQRKINTSLSNGSLHPVTITGITIAWRDETGLYLTGITFGASRIWPEVPESLSSTANITDNWDPLGDRSLLPGSQKNLVFTFTRIGGAQLRSLQYLNIQLDNGCNISKQ